jgi:hypothetical protein
LSNIEINKKGVPNLEELRRLPAGIVEWRAAALMETEKSGGGHED